MLTASIFIFKTLLPTSFGASSYSLNINIFITVTVVEHRQLIGVPVLVVLVISVKELGFYFH